MRVNDRKILTANVRALLVCLQLVAVAALVQSFLWNLLVAVSWPHFPVALESASAFLGEQWR